MQDLGVFGNDAYWGLQNRNGVGMLEKAGAAMGGGRRGAAMLGAAPMATARQLSFRDGADRMDAAADKRKSVEEQTRADDQAGAGFGGGGGGGGDDETGMVQPTVRKLFADSAAWAPRSPPTALDGTAEVGLTMPENLTGWKVRAWGWAPAPRSARARPRSPPPRTCSSACRPRASSSRRTRSSSPRTSTTI